MDQKSTCRRKRAALSSCKLFLCGKTERLHSFLNGALIGVPNKRFACWGQFNAITVGAVASGESRHQAHTGGTNALTDRIGRVRISAKAVCQHLPANWIADVYVRCPQSTCLRLRL